MKLFDARYAELAIRRAADKFYELGADPGTDIEVRLKCFDELVGCWKALNQLERLERARE
jgi:hypothetical protein